jgi:hypothetical protein
VFLILSLQELNMNVKRALVAAGVLAAGLSLPARMAAQETIKIGVLHSLSGP